MQKPQSCTKDWGQAEYQLVPIVASLLNQRGEIGDELLAIFAIGAFYRANEIIECGRKAFREAVSD